MSRKKLTSQWLKALGAGAVTAGVMDAAWIGGAALKIYESKIPHLMAGSVNVLPAALFYTVHLAGTTYLVVRPGDETRTHLDRLRDGAVLGVIAWGTFGLTNAAVLDRFPLSIALVDTVWGGVLTGTVALVAGKATEISRAKKSEGA